MKNVSLPAPLSRGVIGGLATDPAGNIYAGVDLAGVGVIAVFDPAGTFIRSWEVDEFLTLRYAIQPAVGPDGLVYVAPSAFHDELVRVFTPAGAPVRTFGHGSGLREVTDIELDAAGNVYVTARARADLGLPDDMVVRFNPAGAIAARLVPAPGKAHQFGNALKGLAVAPDGSAYVTMSTLDTSFPKVVGVDRSGARLPVPDFAFVIPGDRHTMEDVDYANGNLYFAGNFVLSRGRSPFGVAVLTLQGKLLDLVIGQGNELAVAGQDLYATGIHGLRSTALGTGADHIDSEIGHVIAKPVVQQNATNVGSHPDCGRAYKDKAGTWNVDVSVFFSRPCDIAFYNFASPCPTGTREHIPHQTYVDGTPIARRPTKLRGFFTTPDDLHIEVKVPNGLPGAVIVEWWCVRADLSVEQVYEWKGQINLVDPSGTVVDASTGRPVERATVRLQFSLRRGGPFATPGISGFTPQVNPQVTGRNGAFGWDVAPGFWRLQITAFGYRAFTSPVYSVPPEVTGLRLKLQRDRRQQARLLDPHAGRAGPVRVGARLARRTRVAGLVLRATRGRLRRITIKAKRFRTASGIALGSAETALRDAYPREATAALLRVKAPSRYRIGKATFTVRRGRVVAIVLR